MTKEEIEERIRVVQSSLTENPIGAGGNGTSLQEVYEKVIGGIGWFHVVASLMLMGGYLSGQYIG
jgi:hypothetical protein